MLPLVEMVILLPALFVVDDLIRLIEVPVRLPTVVVGVGLARLLGVGLPTVVVGVEVIAEEVAVILPIVVVVRRVLEWLAAFQALKSCTGLDSRS